MKKIILFLILSIMSFSDCSYVTEPSLILRKFIESVRELKLENKVYCDADDLKMVYYYSNDKEDIDIGLVKYVENLEEVTEQEAFNYMSELITDSSKIFDTFSKKTKNIRADHEDIPNNVHVRFYIEERDNDAIMIGKTVSNLLTSDSELYFNKEFEDTLRDNDIKDYYLTDDMVY